MAKPLCYYCFSKAFDYENKARDHVEVREGEFVYWIRPGFPEKTRKFLFPTHYIDVITEIK
jgi:hypothetical protein